MTIRRIYMNGCYWLSEGDLKSALLDEELIKHAAAMAMVSKNKGDDAMTCLRNAMAYFYYHAAGVDDK